MKWQNKDEMLKALQAAATGVNSTSIYKLYRLLTDAEASNLWRETGTFSAFDQFIRKLGIGTVSLYRRYKTAAKAFRKEDFEAVGFWGVLALAERSGAERQEAYAALKAFVADKGHMPSNSQVSGVLRDLRPPTDAGPATKTPSRAELLVENERLRAENEQLRSENTQLKAEKGNLEKRLARALRSSKLSVVNAPA